MPVGHGIAGKMEFIIVISAPASRLRRIKSLSI
jgi:hypothetical protein